jgi:hypothetical protein
LRSDNVKHTSEFGTDDARDDYDDVVVDDCASVATDSTMGNEKDGDGKFGAY